MKQNLLSLFFFLIAFYSIGQTITKYGTGAGNVATGTYSAFFGYNAGLATTSPSYNSMFGGAAGVANTTGTGNSFFGYVSGYVNTTGSFNTFYGRASGYANTTGSNSTYIGHYSGFYSTGSNNTSIGTNSLFTNTSGTYNTALGNGADVSTASLTNATAVGNTAIVTTSNAVQLGNSSVTQIFAGTGTTATVVAGGLKITGGTLAAGKVLTSDANGVATWQVAGGSSQWATSGTNINFNTGIVSIGTTLAPTSYKLAVGGKIVAEEIVVKLQANWPDYVFESNYKLPSLSELEKFIIINKHLPGVPSAAEVKENGLSVGEMNAILLKKVEELTLILIQQQKELELLKTQSNRQQLEIDNLK